MSSRTIRRNIFTALVLLWLASCAATGPKFQPAPAPTGGSSLVYVYRPDSWQNASISPAIILDGRERFVLKNDGYSYFYLKPGPHTFALEMSEKYQSYGRLELKTEAGRSYYLRLDAAMRIGIGITKGFELVRVAEDRARDEIKDCAYLDPKKSALEDS
jgi:transposase